MRIINDGSGKDIKSIEFRGRLNITTDSGMTMNVPASSITGAAGYMVKLVHSDGSLDVRHGEYKCNRADNITIKPANTSRNKEPKYVNGNTHIQLMNGYILAYGQAETLEFREHNFNWPIFMMIKEGKLALLTGLLGSLFTLVMTRLISRFKKKNE
jgi:hypothetical protein